MVVAMDPESGLVTTLVGGRDYEHSEFDRAFQAVRQPGSAFKPIVYAAALSQGTRLSDRISTAPVKLASTGMPDWEPGDHVGVSELTVRSALVQSSNSATVRIGQSVGVSRVAGQGPGGTGPRPTTPTITPPTGTPPPGTTPPRGTPPPVPPPPPDTTRSGRL